MVFLPVMWGHLGTLEQCTADALMDMWPWRAAFNVKVVLLLLWDVGRVDIRIHQAVRRMSHGSHHVPKVHDKHAVVMHLRVPLLASGLGLAYFMSSLMYLI